MIIYSSRWYTNTVSFSPQEQIPELNASELLACLNKMLACNQINAKDISKFVFCFQVTNFDHFDYRVLT